MIVLPNLAFVRMDRVKCAPVGTIPAKSGAAPESQVTIPMLATENPQLDFVSRGTSCQNLRLRLLCPGQLEQVVELPSGKTTIGSSPRCHVRFQQPGVHPVHCLIFATAEGVSVRRWATDTLLNGVPFDETELNVGDVLSVGSVDLQVVDAMSANTHRDPGDASISHRDPTDNDLTSPEEVCSLVEHTDEDTSLHDGSRPIEHRGNDASLTDEASRPNLVPSAPVQSEVTCPVTAVTNQRRERLSPSDISFVANVEHVLAQLRRSCEVARTRSRKLLATLRRDRDSQRKLMEQVAATEMQLQTAASAWEEAAAKLSRAELQLANAQRRERELELLSSEHQKLVATHGQLVGANAELESQIQRLAAEQAASTKSQHTLATESAALAAESQRLSEENARLLDGSAKLTDECATLADECERVRQANAKLQADFARLAQEKDVVASQNGLLSNDNQALVKEHERLRQENTQAWDKIARLTSDNNALADLRSSLVEEREQFRTELDQFRAEATALTTAKQAFENKSLELANECDQLAQENASVHDALEQLTQGNVQLGRERSVLTEERDRLRQEFAQAGNEVARLNQEKASLVAENAAIAAEQERLRQENTQVWDKVVRLSEENTALVESGPTHSQELEQFRQDNDQLRDDFARLSGEVTRLTGEHQAMVEDRDRLLQENNRLRDEIAQAVNESTAAKEKSQNFGEVYELLREENDRLLGDISQLQDSLAKPTDEKAALIGEHKALADALSEERRFRETLEKRQEEQSVALASQKDFVNALQRQLDDSQRDLAEAGKTIARFEVCLSDKYREVGESTAKIESLEQQLVAQTYELSKAAPALQEHDRQLRDELPNVASAWSAPVATELPSATQEIVARLPSFSIWNQGKSKTESPLTGPSANVSPEFDSAPLEADWVSSKPSVEIPSTTNPWTVAEHESVAASPRAIPQAAESTSRSESFIERYAHMLVDDEAEGGHSTFALQAPTTSFGASAESSVVQKPSNMGVVSRDGLLTADVAHDEEESIEQYMVKMMQRIRGDGPHVAASQVATASYNAETQLTKPMGTSLPQAVQVNEVLPNQAAIQVPTPNLEELMRKGPILERSIDLEAFRALANESARRAIGVHATRKHRREAVTKVIVSTLSGMTSAWLMLNAPDWRDWQFITGCVLLLIAAYWGGQAYGALRETVRAGDYDRSEEEATNALEPLRTILPIDVEYE